MIPSSSPTNNTTTTTSTSSRLTAVVVRSRHLLLLCGITLVGCYLWWGRLPVDSLTNAVVETLKSSGSSDTNNNPPSYLFQSDLYAGDEDDNEDQEDIENVPPELKGERIRTKNNGVINKQHKKRNSTSVTKPKKQQKDPFANKPKMVWLMSYPNSGTSYTMMMVARGASARKQMCSLDFEITQGFEFKSLTNLLSLSILYYFPIHHLLNNLPASNRATATNYGREVTTAPTPNTPLYDGHYEGPYIQPNKRSLPNDYILVKTHCGGRCIPCGPDKYIINQHDFAKECRRGSGLFPNATNNFEIVHYPEDWVHKAIHLIRSPFDNLVSRFHLERKHLEETANAQKLERYPNNATGFQQFCADMNAQYGPSGSGSSKSSLLPSDVVQLMTGIPCHAEFYKWTQWHNHVFSMLQPNQQSTAPKKPTLLLHYEDYERDWNATTDKLFDFLHLQKIGAHKEFSARHDYGPYFTPQQRTMARKLVQRLASSATWEQTHHYFPTTEATTMTTEPSHR